MDRQREEGPQVEFKREYSASVTKDIVAFLNTAGGHLFIGVDDEGASVGLEDPHEAVLQVENAVRDGIRPDPSLFVSSAIDASDGAKMVSVTVLEGTQKPYYLAGKGLRPEGVYVRRGSSAAPASMTVIRRMIRESDGAAFERRRSLEQDLTFEKLSLAFNRAGIDFSNAQIRSLGLVSNDGVYTNLALILSEQCPFTVKLARLSGTSAEFSFQDRSELSGSILSQLEEAYAFLDGVNRLSSTFDGLERVDSRDYPDVALREALMNAFVHRDYGANAPLLIKAFDSELQFVNLGGLMPNVEVEDIRNGVSSLRNPGLANIFYRLSLIEAYGTGLGRIFGAYRYDDVQPRLECTRNSFVLSLPNRNERGGPVFGRGPADDRLRVLEGAGVSGLSASVESSGVRSSNVRSSGTGSSVGGFTAEAWRKGGRPDSGAAPSGGDAPSEAHSSGKPELASVDALSGGGGAPGFLPASRTELGEPNQRNAVRVHATREHEFLATFDPDDVERTVHFIELNGSASRRQVEELLGLKQTAAGKILRGLVEANVLKREGRGPQTRYEVVG